MGAECGWVHWGSPPTLYTLSIGETRYALLCATRSNIDTRSTVLETALLWQAFKK
jgi:hypothetical protein